MNLAFLDGTFQRRFVPAIVKTALLSTPSTTLAQSGERLVGSFLILAFWFVVWLIVFAVSFIAKTKPRTIERYLLWAIRFSFPLWFAWIVVDYKYINPYLSRINAEQNELLKSNAKQVFDSLCEKHTPQATRILKVLKGATPKSIFIEQPDELFGLEVSLKLARCVTSQATPACSQLKLESIEWAWLHTKDFAPCKNGVQSASIRCLPEYKRFDIGERNFNLADIEQPTSDYVVRVDQAVQTGEQFENIRRYRITLEPKGVGQPLATTEILASWLGSAPCPNPENEVAQMLLAVFPQQ